MTKAKCYHVGENGLAEGEALGRITVYLKADYDNARRTAEHWKSEHLAGNAVIEQLEAELAQIKKENEWIKALNAALDKSNLAALQELAAIKAERDRLKKA